MKRLGSKFYMGLIYLFLYAPIAVMIIFSFNDSKSRTVWEGFTLRWYQQLFHDDMVLSSLYVTLTVALLASLIATLLGTTAALGIYSMKKVPRKLVLSVNDVPVMNPDIITGVSLMLLFIFARIEMGFGTLLLSHITFNIPYVILSVMPKLRQFDPALYDAAMDLGATPRKAFFKVLLPEILPGVVTGAILAFTLSIDDFLISYFTSGSQVQVLAVTIFSMTRRRVSPEINALSTLMFVVVLALLVVVNVRSGAQERKAMLAAKKSRDTQ